MSHMLLIRKVSQTRHALFLFFSFFAIVTNVPFPLGVYRDVSRPGQTGRPGHFVPANAKLAGTKKDL